MRQDGLRQKKRAACVEVDVLVPFLQGDGLEGRHDGDAGVVDEDVDLFAAGLLQDLGDEVFGARRGREVGLDGECVLRVCRVQGADLVQYGFGFGLEMGLGIVGGDEGSSRDEQV